MYNPRHFHETDPARLFDFIEAYSFGVLIVPDDSGAPEIAHLPFLLDRAAGPHGALRCHVAKANSIWRLAQDGRPVTAVFQGPHAYISPRWYVEPSRQVPTWNYAVVHATGRARAPLPEAELRALLQDLSAANEPEGAPWTPASTEPGFIDGLLGAIVGLSITIERLEGKFKLGQNRAPEDRARVRRELEARGGESDREMLRWVPPT